MILTANLRGDGGCRRRPAIVLVIAACVLSVTGSGAEAASEVKYRDGRLWLAIHERPAGTVLATVSKSAGITIVVPGSMADKLVSVTAAGLPVQAAVERLLRAAGYSSYVLVYEADGQARRLVVLDHGSEPGRNAPALSHVSGAPPPASRSTTPPSSRWPSPPVVESAPAATRASGHAPAPAIPAATPGLSHAPSRAAPSGQSLRQQIDAWNTLSAAERHQIRAQLQRLPQAERLQLTLYYRHHVLGHPIDDD